MNDVRSIDMFVPCYYNQTGNYDGCFSEIIRICLSVQLAFNQNLSQPPIYCDICGQVHSPLLNNQAFPSNFLALSVIRKLFTNFLKKSFLIKFIRPIEFLDFYYF